MASTENTLGEVNRKYWNAEADSTFDQDWVQHLARQITDFLQANLVWIGLQPKKPLKGSEFPDEVVTMLDYACGDGVASRALYPYVSAVRGIDVSDGMVEKFNEAARMQGLSKQQMYAIKGDLQSTTAELTYPDLQGEDFFGFHIIIMSMGLHHIENPQDILTRFVERLKDGGVVIIIDWVSEHEKLDQGSVSKRSHDVDPRSHSDKHGHHSVHHTIAHAGFSEDQMHRMLKQAGCSEVDYVLLPEPSRVPPEIGEQKRLFFARGSKGAQ